MNAPNFILQFALTGLFLLPAVGGLIIALFTWTRHPRVSLFAAIGCVMLILGSMVTVGYQVLAIQGGFDRSVFEALSLLASLLRMVGFCLILAAVFVDRREPKTSRFDDPDAPLTVPRRDDPRIQSR
jgi:hypothetical protein